MKLFRLLVLLGTACFGQTPTPPAPIIPAHSVSGDATIDIADVDIKTAYGTTETKTAISVCVSKFYEAVQVTITGLGIDAQYQLAPILQPITALGNCATVMGPSSRATLQSIQVYLSNTSVIVPSKPPTATPQSLRAK